MKLGLFSMEIEPITLALLAPHSNQPASYWYLFYNICSTINQGQNKENGPILLLQ